MMYLPLPKSPVAEVAVLVCYPPLIASLLVVGIDIIYSIGPFKEPSDVRQEAAPSGIAVTALLVLMALTSDDSNPAPIFWFFSLALVWVACCGAAQWLVKH